MVSMQERFLRYVALQNGLKISKDNTNKNNYNYNGGYMLKDYKSGRILAGERYELDIKQVSYIINEIEMKRLTVQQLLSDLDERGIQAGE